MIQMNNLEWERCRLHWETRGSREGWESFNTCCNDNHLKLNISKTKELGMHHCCASSERNRNRADRDRACRRRYTLWNLDGSHTSNLAAQEGVSITTVLRWVPNISVTRYPKRCEIWSQSPLLFLRYVVSEMEECGFKVHVAVKLTTLSKLACLWPKICYVTLQWLSPLTFKIQSSHSSSSPSGHLCQIWINSPKLPVCLQTGFTFFMKSNT